MGGEKTFQLLLQDSFRTRLEPPFQPNHFLNLTLVHDCSSNSILANTSNAYFQCNRLIKKTKR
jgi:hypothetical protein